MPEWSGLLDLLDRYGLMLVAAYGALSFVTMAVASYTLQAISDKTSAIPAWISWVPILQTYAFLRAVETSFVTLLAVTGAGFAIAFSGWILPSGVAGVLLPLLIVLYIVSVIVWMGRLLWRLAERRDLSGWVGLACLVPGIGLLVLPYVALHDGLVRANRAGLALTVLLSLLAAVSLQADLRNVRAVLAVLDAEGPTLDGTFDGTFDDAFDDAFDKLGPEERAQLTGLVGELRVRPGGAEQDDAAPSAPRSGPEAGVLRGLLDRLLSGFSQAAASDRPAPDEIPERVACDPETTPVGAPPPDDTEMWCERIPSGERHGEYLSWHPNGRVHEKGRYRDGQRHGTWTRYWPSGGPRARVHFEDGREHGLLVHWNEWGQPEREVLWQHGQPAG